jgi:hypothetical protein
MKLSNLTIHPNDRSTDFLRPIYAELADNKLITSNKTNSEIEMEIKSAHRVILLGHGMPTGLLSVGQFPTNLGLVISSKHANLLRGKSNNVYIWCHANYYVEKHELEGFYTGMFISEIPEAVYCGLPNATEEMIEESNSLFSEIVGKNLNLSAKDLLSEVMRDYGGAQKDNPIIEYNSKRLRAR